jgi:hypothetical protein
MEEVMVAAMEEAMEEVTVAAMDTAATVSAICILAADIMAAEGSTRWEAQAFTAVTPSRHGTARISVRFEMPRSDPEISITR